MIECRSLVSYDLKIDRLRGTSEYVPGACSSNRIEDCTQILGMEGTHWLEMFPELPGRGLDWNVHIACDNSALAERAADSADLVS